MTKKQKLSIIMIFAAIIAIAAGIAVFLNIRETQEGNKSFQVEIISERDNYHKKSKEKSDLLYLGEYLRVMEGCEYEESEFVIFITGFHGMKQDLDQQIWWNLAVNGENALVGVDEISLTEGDVYTFSLMEGW